MILNIIILTLATTYTYNPAILSPIAEKSILKSYHFLSLTSFSALSTSNEVCNNSTATLSMSAYLLRESNSTSSIWFVNIALLCAVNNSPG